MTRWQRRVVTRSLRMGNIPLRSSSSRQAVVTVGISSSLGQGIRRGQGRTVCIRIYTCIYILNAVDFFAHSNLYKSIWR
jgi:hypothetical protein